MAATVSLLGQRAFAQREHAITGTAPRLVQRPCRAGFAPGRRSPAALRPSPGARGRTTQLRRRAMSRTAEHVAVGADGISNANDDRMVELLWEMASVSPSWPSAFSLGETANGRGVVVREGLSVKPGDVVAAISLEHAVVADESAIGICSDTHLALLLLSKIRDPSSLFHAGYHLMLPSSVDIASLWTERELRELQCEEIAESARCVRQHFEAQYEELKLLEQEGLADLAGTVSWEEFQWAMSMVHSRSFCVRPGDGRVLRCIVPFADMFNHDPLSPDGKASLEWRARRGPESAGELTFEMVAQTCLGSSEEMLISYGPKKNADLLIEYGFVPPENSWDRAVLYETGRDLFDDDLHWPDDPMKVLLHKEELVSGAVPVMSYLTSRPDGTCRGVCGLLRIMYSDLQVLPFLTPAGSEEGVLVYEWNSEAREHLANSTELGLLVAKAESEVRAHVVRRCTELLEDFPTTLDEDTEIAQRLANESTANGQPAASVHRLQLAVQLRIGIKEMLHKTIQIHTGPC